LEADALPSSPRGRGWFCPKRAQDALGIERNLAQAHSDGVKDRVGNRGRHWERGRFASGERRHLWVIEQRDVHLGHILKSDDRVAAPIQALHAGRIELHFFEQRPAGALLESVNFEVMPSDNFAAGTGSAAKSWV
jgi:hypothetical protein